MNFPEHSTIKTYNRFGYLTLYLYSTAESDYWLVITERSTWISRINKDNNIKVQYISSEFSSIDAKYRKKEYDKAIKLANKYMNLL